MPDRKPKMAELGAQYLVNHIQSLGYNSEEDHRNFENTPARVAKTLGEFVYPLEEIKRKLAQVLATRFPMTGDAGIVIQDCVTTCMCPHHMLPVINQIYIGYLPKDNGSILGMSKLIRVADILSRRAILQEKLAIDITAALYNGYYDDAKTQPTGFPFIETAGSICMMASLHCCMATRGIRSFSLAREVSLRGAFKHNNSTKEEAYRLISLFPSTQFPLK